MAWAAVVAFLGESQATNLLKRDVLRRYTDENPLYQAGLRGQKPMCYWATLGDKMLQPRKQTHSKTDEAEADEQRGLEQEQAIASLTTHINLLTRRCELLERRLREIQRLAGDAV